MLFISHVRQPRIVAPVVVDIYPPSLQVKALTGEPVGPSQTAKHEDPFVTSKACIRKRRKAKISIVKCGITKMKVTSSLWVNCVEDVERSNRVESHLVTSGR